ncbi:unnamed protein product, partial [Brassica rapa]
MAPPLHANEEIRSCKNLQQMEIHTHVRLLNFNIIFSLEFLDAAAFYTFLLYSYADILGFGIHVNVDVHPNTSLSRIKKKKENNDAHKQLGENK